jgi:hypothetical protein
VQLQEPKKKEEEERMNKNENTKMGNRKASEC